MKYRRILGELYGVPWAIQEEKLQEIVSLVESRAAGDEISEADLERFAVTVRGTEPGERTADVLGRIAVLPLDGVMSRRMNLFQMFSGGTSTEIFGAEYAELVSDPSIEAIVLLVDSPGGSANGTPELAQLIRDGSKLKRTIAVVEGMAASAAYYVASAAPEVVVAPSALVGSVGVVVLHTEFSARDSKAGIARTYIYAGKHKVDGNPDEPLSGQAKATIQRRVDAFYSDFVGAVAEYRGQDVDAVRSSWGQGDVYTAEEALSLGMVDRIATLDEVLAELGVYGAKSSVRRSSADAQGSMVTNCTFGGVTMAKEKAALSAEESVEESERTDLDAERERLEAESAAIDARDREASERMALAEEKEKLAAKKLAAARAAEDLEALRAKLPPSVVRAGAAELLEALELGADSVEIGGSKLDLRAAVLGLLSALPDLSALGVSSEALADPKESGDGPVTVSPLCRRHGIDEERLAYLNAKYGLN